MVLRKLLAFLQAPFAVKPPASPELAFGKSKFEYVEVLGIGPWAERVSRVRPSGGVGETRVVKHFHVPPNRELRARLLNALDQVQSLTHPCIGRIHAYAPSDWGLHVLMDDVPGCSLASPMESAWRKQRCFSEAFAAYVGAEVAGALHAAHSAEDADGRRMGIVHRNVRAGRIRFGPGGVVKLTDFGLFSLRGPARANLTLCYRREEEDITCPEELSRRGQDASADLCALGLLLLELTTGNRALCTSAWGSARGVPSRGFPENEALRLLTRWVSPSFGDILHRLLRLDPKARYASGAQLQADLRGLISSSRHHYGRAEMEAEMKRMMDSEPAPLLQAPLRRPRRRNPGDITTEPGAPR